ATCVAVQPNGKIVVAGKRDNGALTILGDHGQFAVARFNVNGTLDNTFDGNGRLTIDFHGGGGSQANALAIQPDGKILLAGTDDTVGLSDLPDLSARNDFAVARLMPNGSLDHSFGTSLLNTQFRIGTLTIDHVDCDDQATAVTVTPDGKI